MSLYIWLLVVDHFAEQALQLRAPLWNESFMLAMGAIPQVGATLQTGGYPRDMAPHLNHKCLYQG